MKTKLLPLFALMLVMGVFLFAGATRAYAAADPTGADSPPTTEAEPLSVDEVWLTGDTLHITVSDKNGGESQTLELNLSDYAKPGDEYVTIQATDKDGRTPNSIQFKNPYYAPQADAASSGEPPPPNSGTGEPAASGGDNTASNGHPFTPDGTGTVVDNATDGDGKEFFTVKTPDGNVFYLIVDRQRNTDNVYLLNAVTEDDLASLAKEGDGKTAGTGKPSPTSPPVTPPAATPEPPAPPAPEKSSNTGSIVFIVIAIVAVGGAGYYFKIVRPKQNGGNAYDDEDGQEGFDDNEELDVADDSEGDDDE
jgi:hypothetical protein